MESLLKKYSLPLSFVVFTTGAIVLVVEIAAIRVLSPYFGNTIYTASSVISTILAALSLGYRIGGRMADKHPTERFFYTLIIISGLLLTLTYIFILFVLPIMGYFFSVVIGPLISAIIIFFAPSLILGMLSPYAIKLQKESMPQEGLGKLTGDIFFWSTLGSIFGSLLAGFYLIPHMGVDKIFISSSLALIILGLVGLKMSSSIDKKIFKDTSLIVLLFMVGMSFNLSFLIFKYGYGVQYNAKILYKKDGIYEQLMIYETTFKETPIRVLNQDKGISGGVNLADMKIAFDYAKYYGLYKTVGNDIKNVLEIGGGTYALPNAIANELKEAEIDVVEIEPSLYDLAKKYFGLEETDRIKNHITDGRRFLKDSDKKYDLIFNDVFYSLYSIPSHFTTIEYFEMIKEKLNPDGIFFANIIGSLSNEAPSFLMSEIKTIKSILPNLYVFATKDPHSINKVQNFIIFAVNNDQEINFDIPQLTESTDEILKNASKHMVNLENFDFEAFYYLTDNFAPIDYLISKDIKRNSVVEASSS